MTETRDRRSDDGRIARLEAAYARLEERVNADRENREQWRAEQGRRMESQNHAWERARQDIEKDRELFMSRETFEARHAELTRSVQAGLDKLEGSVEAFRRLVDEKMDQHNRADMAMFDGLDRRVKPLEEFAANTKGRGWALGLVLPLIVSGLVSIGVAVLVHVLTK